MFSLPSHCLLLTQLAAYVPCRFLADDSTVTRSHKYTDRDYSNDGEKPEHVPKYFAKAGFVDVDPKKVKKEGGGKGNW